MLTDDPNRALIQRAIRCIQCVPRIGQRLKVEEIAPKR
jgi:hypothetical protein